MAGTTGSIQYANTGESTPIGIVKGGSWGEDTNAQVRTGIGGVGTWKAGPAVPTISGLNYYPCDANSLFDKILRSSLPSGLPTTFDLRVGDSEKGVSGASWYVNRADIACEENGTVEFTLECMLFGKPTLTGGLSATEPTTTFEWYRGECQIGGANKGIRAFKLSVDNALIPFFSLNSKTDGAYRYPEYGVAGAQKVELSLAFLAWPSIDPSDDEITTGGNVVLRMVNDAASAKTLTVTVATPKVISWQSNVVDNDTLVGYDVVYRLDYNSSGITITCP